MGLQCPPQAARPLLPPPGSSLRRGDPAQALGATLCKSWLLQARKSPGTIAGKCQAPGSPGTARALRGLHGPHGRCRQAAPAPPGEAPCRGAAAGPTTAVCSDIAGGTVGRRLPGRVGRDHPSACVWPAALSQPPPKPPGPKWRSGERAWGRLCPPPQLSRAPARRAGGRGAPGPPCSLLRQTQVTGCTRPRARGPALCSHPSPFCS